MLVHPKCGGDTIQSDDGITASTRLDPVRVLAAPTVDANADVAPPIDAGAEAFAAATTMFHLPRTQRPLPGIS